MAALFITTLCLLSQDALAFGKKPIKPPPTQNPNPPPTDVIRARWEFSQRDGAEWSKFVFGKISTEGADLINRAPADVGSFCPNYSNLSTADKKNFWVYLLSAMSEFESGHNPDTYYVENFKDQNGKFVVSRGLLQISIESANAYGCGFKTESELHDPERNLSCSLRILNRWVKNDGRIAGKSGTAWQGGARYWSVLRNTNNPFAKIQAWTQDQEICVKR